ncbi:DNA-binding response regulator [Streptomyces profundus]|uniref:DNA-binding response regulator n=1 Tax=Streptomyces profundus TaxID=2867410 RepID=UPI001D16494D|nr:DNA-binding response regulator [Streptomyces sp. MA3_2.13]UED86497.1 DNA-binding response regulator [Streptomyces sp. MA3_2.13]
MGNITEQSPSRPLVAGDPPGDEVAEARRVERTLLEATALIDSVVSVRVRPPAQRSAVRHLDARHIPWMVGRLIDRAEHFVVVTTAGRPGATRGLAVGLRALEAARARGVPARVLLAPSVLRFPRARLIRLANEGCEIRVDSGEPRETLLIDGVLALVVPPAGAVGQRPLLVNDPAVVAVTCQLLKGTWNSAMPLREFHGAVSHLRAEPMQTVLRYLRDGLTDEVAAGEMRVSLRTYRRKVAHIMEELGIVSRFQAGARAAELGVLPIGDA